ncbi:MAG: hypothetical protein HY901_01340 [Deltaproteobacteria bacterium]|nr:hypothetical protein [Deltaproteobacteria bacterium]
MKSKSLAAFVLTLSTIALPGTGRAGVGPLQEQARTEVPVQPVSGGVVIHWGVGPGGSYYQGPGYLYGGPQPYQPYGGTYFNPYSGYLYGFLPGVPQPRVVPYPGFGFGARLYFGPGPRYSYGAPFHGAPFHGRPFPHGSFYGHPYHHHSRGHGWR